MTALAMHSGEAVRQPACLRRTDKQACVCVCARGRAWGPLQCTSEAGVADAQATSLVWCHQPCMMGGSRSPHTTRPPGVVHRTPLSPAGGWCRSLPACQARPFPWHRPPPSGRPCCQTPCRPPARASPAPTCSRPYCCPSCTATAAAWSCTWPSPCGRPRDGTSATSSSPPSRWVQIPYMPLHAHMVALCS